MILKDCAGREILPPCHDGEMLLRQADETPVCARVCVHQPVIQIAPRDLYSAGAGVIFAAVLALAVFLGGRAFGRRRG